MILFVGLLCAQGLTNLDLSHNSIVLISEMRKLAALEHLNTLAVTGELGNIYRRCCFKHFSGVNYVLPTICLPLQLSLFSNSIELRS